MYFRAVPNFLYKFNNSQKIVKDIFRRAGLQKKYEQRAYLVPYFIRDGVKPEDIAYEQYGSAKYHWVILMFNDIINVNEEWPIHSNDLFRYCTDKYGTNNVNDTHHYVKAGTDIICDYEDVKFISGDIAAVTNYQYEENLNDEKRQIKLLNRKYLKTFTSEYKKLIKT
jgi:hypothetical protein